GKQHRFKPTGDAPAANLEPARRRVVKTEPGAGKVRQASSSRSRGRSTSSSAIVLDPNKPTRPYAISERFALGDQIQHKKFGPGVVCAVEDDKIRVNFADSTKVLLHGKS